MAFISHSHTGNSVQEPGRLTDTLSDAGRQPGMTLSNYMYQEVVPKCQLVLQIVHISVDNNEINLDKPTKI